MRVIRLEETSLTLPELADMARVELVILTRDDKPLAAVKDLTGSDLESVALAHNPHFLALIEESRRSYREEGGVSLEDIRKQLGLKAKPRARGGKKAANSGPSE